MSRTEGTRGVKKTLYESALKSKDYNGRVLYELNSEKDFFKVRIEKEVLKEGTVNKGTSIKDIKWLIIKEGLWDQHVSNYPKLDRLSCWNKLKEVFTLNKDYYVLKGDEQEISIATITNKKSNKGDIYLVIPFLFFPDKALAEVNFVILAKPMIEYAHFVLDKYVERITDTERLVYYGSLVNIEIKTLLLPNASNNNTKFAFEIDLIDNDTKKVVYTYTGLEIPTQSESRFKFTRIKTFSLQIPYELKVSHSKDQFFRSFSFKVRGSEVLMETSMHDGTLKLPTDVTYNSLEDTTKWVVYYNGEYLCNTSSYLIIPNESYSKLLKENEKRKKDTLQYIGDIEYSQRNNDPCSYSKIKIKCEDQEKYIFDETEKVLDLTETSYFDIIAGTDPKDIIISVEKLRTPPSFIKNDECKGVLLTDNQKHDKWENIFQMGSVLPSYTNAVGKRTADEGFRIKSEMPIQNVAAIQGLVYNKHYFKNSDSSLRLKIGYNYDQTYEDETLDYLAFDQDFLKYDNNLKSLSNIWVVKYLIKLINKEELFQTYFVPISTCRYPNQIAQIHVYPDMRWIINFNYNIKTPLYYKANASLIEYYSGYLGGPVQSQNRTGRDEILSNRISNELQHDVGRKTNFSLYVECEVNGKGVIKLGDEFGAKFRKMLGPLLWIVNKLDKDMGISAAEEEQRRLQSNATTSRGLLDRMNKLPMSFKLIPPAVGLAVDIGYGIDSKGSISYELGGMIKADPIIGASVKLDILALGSKFKPWGAIIDALDIVSFCANLFSGGKVQLNYEMYFELSAQIVLVGEGTKDGVTNPAGFTYNFSDKKITKSSIGLQGVIKGEFIASIALEIYVKKKKKRSFLGTYEDIETATKLGVSVEGTALVSLTLNRNFGKNNIWNTDFYFSGVSLKIVFSASAKVTDEEKKTKKIVPSLNKEINIFNNKGEYK